MKWVLLVFSKNRLHCNLHVDFFFLFEASEELFEINKSLKRGITVLFATKASLANAGLSERAFQLWTRNGTVTS